MIQSTSDDVWYISAPDGRSRVILKEAGEAPSYEAYALVCQQEKVEEVLPALKDTFFERLFCAYMLREDAMERNLVEKYFGRYHKREMMYMHQMFHVGIVDETEIAKDMNLLARTGPSPAQLKGMAVTAIGCRGKGTGELAAMDPFRGVIPDYTIPIRSADFYKRMKERIAGKVRSQRKARGKGTPARKVSRRQKERLEKIANDGIRSARNNRRTAVVIAAGTPAAS